AHGAAVITAGIDNRALEEETEGTGDDQQRIEARECRASGEESADVFDRLAEMDQLLRRARRDHAIALHDRAVQHTHDAARGDDAVVFDEGPRFAATRRN